MRPLPPEHVRLLTSNTEEGVRLRRFTVKLYGGILLGAAVVFGLVLYYS